MNELKEYQKLLQRIEQRNQSIYVKRLDEDYLTISVLKQYLEDTKNEKTS